MDQAAFIRQVTDSLGHYFWFLGAGTSQSAGLPTAADVIWDLKRRFYNTEENQSISPQDIQNPAVREKIQSFMLSRGFPDVGAPGEYSAYFELIFKDDAARQQKYIRAILSDNRVSLSIGHRVLAALLAERTTRVVFTTNFDGVIEKAFAEVSGNSLSAYHLEGSYAANAAINNEDFPIYVKLHGDFRYESLKNLPEDLKKQDAELGKSLLNASNRFGMIVAGYSGRDESIMELFNEALKGANPFPHGIYWTVLKSSRVLPAVTQFIDRAKAKGIKAEIVEIETFESLMSRIWTQIPNKNAAYDAKVRHAALQSVSIPLPPTGTKAPLLRMNGLPILSLPSKCLRVSVAKEVEWADVKDAEHKGGDALALTKADGLLAWGLEANVRNALGGIVTGIQEADLQDSVVKLSDNLVLKAFVERALCLAIKRDRPVLYRTSRNRHFLIANKFPIHAEALKPLSALVGNTTGVAVGQFSKPTERHPEREQISWAESVELHLEERDGKYWLLIQPDVWIWPKHARQDSIKLLDERRGKRYNQLADKILSAWIDILFPGGEKGQNIEIKAFGSGTNAENPAFTLSRRTSYSRGRAA